MIDTLVDGAFTLHRGHLREGRIELGAAATARVDAERRQGIRRAHSATHLLHYALQKHLGKHALQQGSKVDDDLLRFDFANPAAVTSDELVRIEDEVNAKILAGEPIGWQDLPLADARKAGAMMLFGEKYPDVVRMVADGPVQQGTLRRHASDEHRPGGNLQDHRRGERGRRHAANHRLDGQGGPAKRPPESSRR